MLSQTKLQRDSGCTLCPLHQTAEYVCLLGQGPLRPKAMVIGEAPGHREDDSGKPFVGKAGKLLDKLLIEAGLTRQELYITNAVHCRPPDNKTPTKKQIEACKVWLQREIDHVKPKVVLLLGNTPLWSSLALKGIRQVRGRPIKRDGVLYLPTYHPAFALRDPRQETVLRNDLATFKTLIEYGDIPQEQRLNIKIVKDERSFVKMLDDIESSSLISFDLETTGLDTFALDFAITSFGVGTRDRQWILPLQHREGFLYDKPQRNYIRRVIKAAEGCKKAAHNGKYDSLSLLNYLHLHWTCEFDTMLAHHLIDENSIHDLKNLAQVYCGAPNYDIDKDQKRGAATLEDLARYHAHDLYYTRKLAIIFEKKLKEDLSLYELFYNLTMPVARLFVDIEYEGVYINTQRLHEVEIELKAGLKKSKEKMDKYAPGLNWGSPKQVGDLLYKKLHLPILKKTKKGAASTDESTLKQLADKHEIPKEMMVYRGFQQNLSFFVEGWQPRLVKSRLHPSFKIHGTVTGRLSCEEPNLQQVPRDPFIRSLIDAPESWELLEADLSQIELRIAAEMANERNMLEAFNTGEDIHWKTAMREISRAGGYSTDVLKTAKAINPDTKSYSDAIDVLLKAGPDACIKIDKRWKERRKKAKAVNFGYLYGMWWKKFIIYARDNYDVIVTEQEAQESRENFFELWPDLDKWHKKQKKFAAQFGYVRSFDGRVRRLPAAMRHGSSYDYEKDEALRQAINSPVQGFASDMNLMALVQMKEEFDSAWYRPIGTVHDSILQYVRKDKVAYVVPRVKKIMSHPRLMDIFGIKLSVPIEAEVSIGKWGSGVSEKEYFQDK